MVITPLAAILFLAVLASTAFWLIWRRGPRSWSSTIVGFLFVCVGLTSIITGETGRLGFPELSATGLQARLFGALCILFGVASLYAGLRPKPRQPSNHAMERTADRGARHF